ncbi:MAG: helicase C-terminal domain-containing protein [Ruminococcus sp.]
MVFFPSYKMLEEVYAVYEEEFSVNWVKCICQNSSMKEQEREEFLQEFEQDCELMKLLALWWYFSEGIDLL